MSSRSWKLARKIRSVHLIAAGTALAVVTLARDHAGATTPSPWEEPSQEPTAAAVPLTPPPITVLQSKPGLERGLVFLGPKTTPAAGVQQGPEIVDNNGRPVWFLPVAAPDQAADFRVQSYRGEPVLTWWQGHNSPTGPGVGQGVDYIFDRTYRQIAVVAAGNGYQADLHEFRLTPRGTAFITIYHHLPYDLSSVGGPANGGVVDGIAQEIDIASGRVVFEWHSLDHVGLDESQAPVPTDTTHDYDYFHINAVNWDEDGNILIDSRNTWTTFKVDHETGKVIWRLGGKRSSFALGENVQFAWQHDPEPVDRTTVRIFDNEAAPAILPASRVIWVRRNPYTHTATLARSIVHPDGLSAGSQGNSQELGHGNTFVGWGATGRVSEFDAEGRLLFDASVPSGWDTYRAYRHVWHAAPDTSPTVTAQRNADGTITVHAIWNGATEVDRWVVVGGARAGALWPLGSSQWNGLDTTIALSAEARTVAVVAVDAAGRWLGRSAPVTVLSQ